MKIFSLILFLYLQETNVNLNGSPKLREETTLDKTLSNKSYCSPRVSRSSNKTKNKINIQQDNKSKNASPNIVRISSKPIFLF